MESERLHLGGLASWFLNAIFPRFCLSCKTEGALLCEVCLASFDDRVFKEEENHLTMFAYGNPVIRNLIRSWKYDYDHSAFNSLRRLAQPGESKIRQFIGDSVIVPIPLSDIRLRERGFNQARKIGEWAAEISGREVKDLLKRGERTGHQAERTEEERKQAMEKSPFLLKSGEVPSEVVIVDDVWTTGSTMRAAERTLRQSGVTKVTFLTIAKG